jgi:hypothetical protein
MRGALPQSRRASSGPADAQRSSQVRTRPSDGALQWEERTAETICSLPTIVRPDTFPVNLAGKARRVISFARYAASQFGSPWIETERLLCEDKALLTNRFLRSDASVEFIRKQIEGHTAIREEVSTSVDLPLSNECKRVLAYAAEEAERLSHEHIGTEHPSVGTAA